MGFGLKMSDRERMLEARAVISHLHFELMHLSSQGIVKDEIYNAVKKTYDEFGRFHNVERYDLLDGQEAADYAKRYMDEAKKVKEALHLQMRFVYRNARLYLADAGEIT